MNMKKQFILYIIVALTSIKCYCQDTNAVELHIKFYSKGVCQPMLKSNHYSTSIYQKTKQVFQSGVYYSNLFTYVTSTDIGDLKPKINHELQASSIELNPNLDYEILLIRTYGFDRIKSDSMVIMISKLNNDAQVALNFESGKFNLEKMEFFKKIKPNSHPKFKSKKDLGIKNTLKLDSISYFANGHIKSKYFQTSFKNLLFFVQEFDSLNPGSYSEGYQLFPNGINSSIKKIQPIWTEPENTKQGYWRYFEDSRLKKHEFWTGTLRETFEWHPNGKVKLATSWTNPTTKDSYFTEKGQIKREFFLVPKTRKTFLREYAYSSKGDVILISTYKSRNGITKQELSKRELFYPSGRPKTIENFEGLYNIKYYNEDGTERIN